MLDNSDTSWSDRQKDVAPWVFCTEWSSLRNCKQHIYINLNIWKAYNSVLIYPYSEGDWKHCGDQTKEDGCNSVYSYNYVHINDMNVTAWSKNSQFQFELQLKWEKCNELQLIYQLPLLQLCLSSVDHSSCRPHTTICSLVCALLVGGLQWAGLLCVIPLYS